MKAQGAPWPPRRVAQDSWVRPPGIPGVTQEALCRRLRVLPAPKG